jgi:hypothetical protein
MVQHKETLKAKLREILRRTYEKPLGEILENL